MSRSFLPDKAIIGMVHVRALPGTPAHELQVERLIATALEEAHSLVDAGCDALIIENMHDRPYLLGGVGPEIVATMTAIAAPLREALDVPLGVQILAGANREALAVASAIGAAFVRVEGFVYAHVADEGLFTDADAGQLLRYRRRIGAADVAVVADIKKKHASHSITADTDILETAKAAQFFGADGLIVTGEATANPASVEEVAGVARSVSIPVMVGSGLSPENLARYWSDARSFIVGSYIKQDGLWSNPIDSHRLAKFMSTVAQLRLKRLSGDGRV